MQCVAGHEALKALESGALLRKKWLGSADAREAPTMTKTERLIRCRMQDGKVVVHYHHKVLSPAACPCLDASTASCTTHHTD